MSTISSELVLSSVHHLFSEIIKGTASEGPAWVLNPGDIGLLDTLGRLTANQASTRLIPDRSTLAAHVNHMRFSLVF